MGKTLSKILFLIVLLASLFVVAVDMQLVNYEFPEHFFAIYALVVMVSSLIWMLLIIHFSNQKPKETVKIVYKTVEVEKKDEKKAAKKKEDTEKQTIKKYVDAVTKDLNLFTDSFEDFNEQLFRNLSESMEIVQGMMFLKDSERNVFYTAGSYAFYQEETYKEYELGEGIVGQAAKDQRMLYIDNVPENYIVVVSGLGKGTPRYLLVLPIVYKKETIAVMEIASFTPFPEPTEKIMAQVAEKLAKLMANFVVYETNEK